MTAFASTPLLTRTRAFLAREWWTHRAFVLVLLGITALTGLTVTLTYGPSRGVDPGHYRTVLASLLATCVGAGLVFLTQRTVGSEYDSPHGDQWLRRIGNALMPSLLAKGAFLAFVAVLASGVAAVLYFLCVRGAGVWSDTTARYDSAHAWQGMTLGLATLPWVWAITTWLPGGRGIPERFGNGCRVHPSYRSFR